MPRDNGTTKMIWGGKHIKYGVGIIREVAHRIFMPFMLYVRTLDNHYSVGNISVMCAQILQFILVIKASAMSMGEGVEDLVVRVKSGGNIGR